jgi:hypothetical protein
LSSWDVLIARGQRESALAEMEKEPAPRFHQVGVALALEMLGQRNESDKELRAAEQKFGDEMGYWIAIVYAARRDPDRAFAWLDRAFHAYGDGMMWIKGDPLLAQFGRRSPIQGVAAKNEAAGVGSADSRRRPLSRPKAARHDWRFRVRPLRQQAAKPSVVHLLV